MVLDVGASIGADAEHLVDLAVMGSAMARVLFDLKRPTVGLLNIGVEEVKGQEAVREARGDLDRQRIEPEVEVPVPAFLPESFLPEVEERLGWYRRFAAASDAAAVDGLLDELEDREGDLPVEVRNLAGLFQVKADCRELGIVRCSWLKVRAVFELHPRTTIPRARLQRIVTASPKRYELIEKEGQPTQLSVRFLPQEAERPFPFLRWVLAGLRRDE